MGDMEAAARAFDAFLDGTETASTVQAAPASGGLVTILFTDIEGSTSLTQSMGDQRAQAVLRTHNQIVRRALVAQSGSEIKHTGDGIMASFPLASSAVACAIAIQRALVDREVEPGQPQLRVRIGLNAGEPVVEDEDLFGTAVQLARRVCDVAKAGEIMTSEVVRGLTGGKEFVFADQGRRALKGFDEPVRLYRVEWSESYAAGPTGSKEPTSPLTARETEVLSLLASGHSGKEIALQLMLSLSTVQRHIANIYAKIGARGRVEAAAYAIKHGLVQPRDS
jgi:adenylate cyclase